MNKAINIIKQNLKNESVVIATSGGPDSMTLLELVNSLKEELNLKLICAHVNHKIREESDEEEAMVKEYCKKNNISCEILTIDNYNDDNFHNDARIKRYNFFEKCVKKCKAKHLLTAHHGDDLTETILMRLVRGSTLKGYAGFEEKDNRENYIILRPLINYTKDEILEYVKKNKIPYAIDKSNLKDKYTRNRFRKYILPKLKEEDQKVHDKFYKFSKTLQMYDEYITKETEKYYKDVYNENLDIHKLKKLPKLIQIKILEKHLYQNYQNDIMLITEKHLNLLEEIIHSDKPNQKINLPNNIIAIKNYNKLSFKQNDNIKDYELELDEFIKLPNGKTIKKSTTTSNSNNTCRLNTKELKLPLYIRNKRNGDKIEVKGLNGTKKIKDIFIDKKVPIQDRSTWPVLVDSKNNILWLPGLKKTKFDKSKEENYDIILEYI